MNDDEAIAAELSKGSKFSAAKIAPLVYSQLRALASKKLRNEAPSATLSATELVHEAYLRVAGDRQSKWDGGGHFYAAAAEAMRRILIDKARRRKAAKHGGGLRREALDSLVIPCEAKVDVDEVLAVHESLDALAEEFPRKAELVKLRYFVGLSNREAAKILKVSVATAERDWAFSRAWLKLHIQGE